MNYNDTNSKKKLLNETNLEKIFDKILLNNEINNKIIYYRNFRRNYNYNSSKGAMLIQPLLDISSNNCIYNPFYDDIRMLLNTNQEEKNNYVKRNYFYGKGIFHLNRLTYNIQDYNPNYLWIYYCIRL